MEKSLFYTSSQRNLQALRTLQLNNPEVFTPEESEELASRMAATGLPVPAGHKNFNLGDTLVQAGSGFVQGFTTLEVGAEPENDAEYIARNLGHLMGFMGVIPGPGMLGKLGGTALVRGASFIGRGLKIARAGEMAARMENLAMLGQLPKFMSLKSVPMYAADKFMESRMGGWLFEGAREGIGLSLIHI